MCHNNRNKHQPQGPSYTRQADRSARQPSSFLRFRDWCGVCKSTVTVSSLDQQLIADNQVQRFYTEPPRRLNLGNPSRERFRNASSTSQSAPRCGIASKRSWSWRQHQTCFKPGAGRPRCHLRGSARGRPSCAVRYGERAIGRNNCCEIEPPRLDECDEMMLGKINDKYKSHFTMMLFLGYSILRLHTRRDMDCFKKTAFKALLIHSNEITPPPTARRFMA